MNLNLLVDLSYDELPTEAKQYIKHLIKTKKPFVSTVLKNFHDIAIKTDDIDVLLSSAFIDADSDRKVGCFWRFKTAIFRFIFSILTGVAIPNLLKKNYCLFLQSLVIASYLVKEGYVILPLMGLQIKQETTKNNLKQE
jgi:hypothetical protein